MGFVLLRSWIYLFAFLTWTIGLALMCTPLLIWRRTTVGAIRVWVHGVRNLARVICGVTFRSEGRENLPKGACIVAAQHQSSFETYEMFLELENPVFVLKRELIYIPVVGWYMQRAGLVHIDRGAGATAMRKMFREAQEALAAGNQVVIFPEGTRVKPGTSVPYKPGVAALYAHCDAPVIPMSLNTGTIWGKTRILKRPGEIVFRYRPALPKGLSRDEMLAELRVRLEAADAELPR
ncbi:MAG: 1-acyl-sn-glycerol-3-phosphate acyltransferase [Rhodospirillaceae bacterium]|nr:1-acyl-sn-glycerol-3-phosphate acyltransferase [Rhodospirillaceae bacterium]